MNNEPQWFNKIFEVFLQSLEWTSLKSPINQTFAYKCQLIDGTWEIMISPWVHEIYGGKHDGAVRLPTYEINLMMIADEFDSVSYMGFDTDRLEASVEGKIDNLPVIIIFRKQAPKSNARKKVNTFTGEVTKIIGRRQ